MISTIPEEFITDLAKSKTLQWLNLANNNLASIPIKFKELNNLGKIWLAGNPFHCDCEMTWMTGFVNNFTSSFGKHIIVDFREMICHSGKMKGKPIYKLDEVKMGCFPSQLNSWQKISIGIGAGISGAIIIILMTLIVRNSRSVQFFIFFRCRFKSILRLNVSNEDDNVDNKQYDAYLSYRYVYRAAC